MRMAMADEMVTTSAVLYALLAFSSLRLNGLDEQAISLKISALEFLSASAKKESLSLAEAAQHVAASMLLSSFEVGAGEDVELRLTVSLILCIKVLISSPSSVESLWYIWGAIDIVKATRLGDQSHKRDIGHLLDWLDYHNLLSHFFIHHRHHKSLSLAAPHVNHSTSRGPQYAILAQHQPTPPSPSTTYVMLNLLSEIYSTSLHPWNHTSSNEEYHSRLGKVEDKIARLHITPVSTTFGADDAVAIQVYQMATRIYFARASQSSWRVSSTVDALIDNIFAGPLPAHACGHFFPVFILVSEARTDKRRTVILDLIDRTEKSARIRMKHLRTTVLAIWAQQDLYADDDLLVDYLSMISRVIICI
ncbi:zinc-finger transcription factor protein [Rutstroemia sp. NJR-2017a BBW]|nr:zinc-finger transcription factor protein [Rutstroemia sp. NJR-2017a BBW]